LEARFHLAIAHATRNPVMVELMKRLLAKIEIAFDMTMRTLPDLEASIEIHVATLAALKSRDPERIATVMDRHMLSRGALRDDGGRLRLRRMPEFLLPRRSA
jgi:DNA-binding GntR family transcriptional regulator